MYGADIAWFALNSSCDKAFGASTQPLIPKPLNSVLFELVDLVDFVACLSQHFAPVSISLDYSSPRSGALQEHDADRFVSSNDDQDVTITLYPATARIAISTTDFASIIERPQDAAFVRPVVFISPGNSVQLLRVRVRSCE
jgi:hypothetical protein